MAALAALVSTPEPTSAPAPRYVLSPAAESAVRGALDLARGLPDGMVLRATLDKDRILVETGLAAAPTLRITLVHPDLAPPEAPRLAGVARLLQPGPAPAALVAEVDRRLAVARFKVPWQQLQPDVVADPVTPRPGASVDTLRESLRAIAHRIDTGEHQVARARLALLPKLLAPDAAIEIALLWRQIGALDQARSHITSAGELGPVLGAAAAVVLDDQQALSLAMDAITTDTACAYLYLAQLQERLAQTNAVVATTRRIRAQDPECVEAWEMEILHFAQLGQGVTAVDLAQKAMARFPDDTSILRASGGAFLAAGALEDAIPLLERAARYPPMDELGLRVLLGAIVRDPDQRVAERTRLEAMLAAEPDDVITRFLLGVVSHYENDFAASSALLAPLEDTLDHVDRLHIYLAMNDFNLGHVDAAVARLRRTAEGDDPDPDVYYCLAETLRDTHRSDALVFLGRYAALSQGNPLSNPDKESRIRVLLALLEACKADGRASCEGPWEHPRLRHQADAAEQEHRAWVVGGGLLIALGLALTAWAIWRRPDLDAI